VSNPEAVTVNPWRMTKVRKKLEAKGRFLASSVGAELRLLTSSGSAAMIPEARVTIKNE
jgi:hypothetical protein